ncbi:MAG: protein kinase [Planctomycetota bacterium]
MVRELGRGGMGVVYEVEHERTRARFALKRLYPGADPEERERFAREVEAQLGLAHPGLVRVHAADLARPDPYLVLDLVSGGSLAERVRARGPLAPAAARRLGLELCDALAYLHERDLLHRDLKPQNVLLDAEGRARLTDFGLVRLRGSLTLTATGELLGTPAYMPPEQVQDSRSVDARADVYALGAVLYEALAGHPPFRGASTLAVLHAVLEEAPAPLEQVAPGCPPALARAVARAMAKEPAARPASARALGALLAAEDLGPAPRGRGRAALVVGTLALALAGGGAAALRGTVGGGAGEGPPPRASATSPPSPSLGPSARVSPASAAALLARAARREAEDASYGELEPLLSGALAAARDDEERRAARSAWLRVAAARAAHERVLELTAGAPGAEARFLRARALNDLGREEEAGALIEALSDGTGPWALAANVVRTQRRGKDPTPELERLAREGRRDELVATQALLLQATSLRARGGAAAPAAALVAGGAERSRSAPLLLELLAAWLNDGSPALRPRAHAVLERLERLCAPAPPVSYFHAAARLAALEGRREEALRLLRTALERDPGIGSAAQLGAELDAQGRRPEAARVWRDGARRDARAFTRSLLKFERPLTLRAARAAGVISLAFLELTQRAIDPERAPLVRSWVDRKVSALQPACRPAARALLSACARGQDWDRLQPLLAGLTAEDAPRDALLCAAEVALWREQWALARELLARARQRTDGADLALLEAEWELRRHGLQASVQAFAAVRERWPGTPQATIAAAFEAVAAGAEDRVARVETISRLRNPPDLVAFAPLYLALGTSTASDWVKALLDRRALADVDTFKAGAQTAEWLYGQRPDLPAESWWRVFLYYEVAIELGAGPRMRLFAAAKAIDLCRLYPGRENPWLDSARGWVEEAELLGAAMDEPARSKIALQVRSLRGTIALLSGGSEEEVLRDWRGLPGDVLKEELRRGFGLRFGHPLPGPR